MRINASNGVSVPAVEWSFPARTPRVKTRSYGEGQKAGVRGFIPRILERLLNAGLARTKTHAWGR